MRIRRTKFPSRQPAIGGYVFSGEEFVTSDGGQYRRDPVTGAFRHIGVGDNHGARKHPESVNRGESHWNSKLTMLVAAKIKKEYSTGQKPRIIAKNLGLNHATVADVCFGRTWRNA